MEIRQDGSWLVDEDDCALILNTASAAVIPFDEGVAPRDRTDAIAELTQRYADAWDDKPEQFVIPLEETKIIEDAITIARDNFHYALGFVSGVDTLEGVGFTRILDVMSRQPPESLFYRAQFLCNLGGAAVELAEIVKMHKDLQH